MRISKVSPFRQLSKAYSAILNIDNVARNLPVAVKGVENALLDIRNEMLASTDTGSTRRNGNAPSALEDFFLHLIVRSEIPARH